MKRGYLYHMTRDFIAVRIAHFLSPNDSVKNTVSSSTAYRIMIPDCAGGSVHTSIKTFIRAADLAGGENVLRFKLDDFHFRCFISAHMVHLLSALSIAAAFESQVRLCRHRQEGTM